MSGVLLEARPFRPFKSSEEYLYAMKEDLAEWFQMLYPHLAINVENFLDRLETGVALCEHANAVKIQAAEYVQKKQARKIMTRSVTSSLAQAQALVHIADVKFFATAKPGTFFARDNVSNFIHWCRQSLQIHDCLLFESDDLIMRKNEKNFILCLLEVARKGAKYGMLAPMLVQMERQIDREIAADQKKLGVGEGTEEENGIDDDSDSELEDEQPVLMYGPLPQIVTNDLKSLDEMVRDLVEKCTCPTQFPMIRVSEGKYRIGDTKVLIFVRILRNHVMVRVGGGWDTLSHYLDKHDPCRCRAQHRVTQGARLVNKPGATDLSRAQVYYDRSPPRHAVPNGTNCNTANKDYLGPPMNSINRSRSRSPSHLNDSRRSVSPNFQRKSLAPPQNRSRSPTPNYTSTHLTKLSTTKPRNHSRDQGPQSLPYIPTYSQNTSPTPAHKNFAKPHVTAIQLPVEGKLTIKTEATLQVNDALTDHSDNGSEVSDEGYRSLGLIHDKSKNRASLYSQNSIEDADETEHQNSIDYEDETNDCGLRRTQFSQKIFGDQTEAKQAKMSKERSFVKAGSVEKSRQDSPSKTVYSRERSFKRSDSSESAPAESLHATPKHTPQPKRVSKGTINNTWNGRQRTSRPSLTNETFSSPFVRNSGSRRSVSSNYDNNGRRVSVSANTSPTKGKLKQELLKAVKNNSDDQAIVEQVQALLKKYGSLTVLGPEDFEVTKAEDDKTTYRSPRKDSRPDNMISRIPAPITHRA